MRISHIQLILYLLLDGGLKKWLDKNRQQDQKGIPPAWHRFWSSILSAGCHIPVLIFNKQKWYCYDLGSPNVSPFDIQPSQTEKVNHPSFQKSELPVISYIGIHPHCVQLSTPHVIYIVVLVFYFFSVVLHGSQIHRNRHLPHNQLQW